MREHPEFQPWHSLSALSQAEVRLGGAERPCLFFHRLPLVVLRAGPGPNWRRPLPLQCSPALFCLLDILPLMLCVLMKPWLSKATQCCLSLRPALTGQCFMLRSFHFLCPYKMSYSSVPQDRLSANITIRLMGPERINKSLLSSSH